MTVSRQLDAARTQRLSISGKGVLAEMRPRRTTPLIRPKLEPREPRSLGNRVQVFELGSASTPGQWTIVGTRSKSFH
jgi:hypothetical protein